MSRHSGERHYSGDTQEILRSGDTQHSGSGDTQPGDTQEMTDDIEIETPSILGSDNLRWWKPRSPRLVARDGELVVSTSQGAEIVEFRKPWSKSGGRDE